MHKKKDGFYSLDLFMDNRNIIKNIEVLKDNYIPPELLFREKEKEDILKEIRVFFKTGIAPNDMFIHGPPSTGKTHMIKKIIQETNRFVDTLKEFKPDNMPEGVENYKMIYTSFNNTTIRQGLGEILGMRLGRAGYTVMDVIYKIIDQEVEGTTTFVFDEIDKVKVTSNERNPINTLISIIKRLRERRPDLPDISLIVIANKDITKYLELATKSVFIPKIIFFRNYKPEEIYKILEDRCKRAFVDGAITKKEIMHLTKKLAKVNDLRFGLKTLIEASKIASMIGADRITVDIIDDAFEQAQRNIIKEKISNCDDTHLSIIYYTALLQKKNGEAPMTEVYNLYKGTALDPLTFSYVSNYVIPQLEAQGLIMSCVKGLGRGKGKARFLSIEEELLDYVLEICKEEIETRLRGGIS